MTGSGVGIVAGALTTGAWLPQLYRTARSRSIAETPSWGYLYVFGLGIVWWIVYGALVADLAVLVWNCVTLGLVLGLAGTKLYLVRAAHAEGSRQGAAREGRPVSAEHMDERAHKDDG